MKASLNLIRKFVDLSGISTEEIVNRLTFSGLEVEGVETLAEATNLVIGEIIECNAHPDSDHLHVLKVNLGEKYGVTQIVCGAPNARVGLKVIVARVGAELKKAGIKIQKSTIRGVESNGMCCALFELGVNKAFLQQKQIDGIEELPDDAIVGNENVLEYLGINDVILDINVLANRSDCLAIFSLAKEIGALFKREVHIPSSVKLEEVPNELNAISLTKNCVQFSLKQVKGVQIHASPKWLSSYLMAHGIRSINNVVDIGNYIMLLTGQPLHMYDLDKLSSKSFVVRDDIEGDFLALDDKIYLLQQGDIVITNNNAVGCLGGIMGAKECAIDENSTNIVVEAANFVGAVVRRTSIRTGLSSDSSARFIKGINPFQDEYVLNLTAQLLKNLAEAKMIYETIRYTTLSSVIPPILCSYSYINKRLGTSFTAEQMNEIFMDLGIQIKAVHEDQFLATPPAHRIDLKCDADLSEEIFRFIGLKTIHPTLPKMVTTVGGYTPSQQKKRRIREQLIASGLHEVVTYTLVSPSQNESFILLNKDEEVQIKNPMTVDHSVVRKGLVNSLLDTLKYNLSHQNKDVALFEISDVSTKSSWYQECTILLNGTRSIRGALEKKAYDFYDIYGYFESICALLGIDEKRYRVERLENSEYYHPGRSVAIYFGKELVGVIGQIHPNYSKDFGETYILDINLTKFLDLRCAQTKMNAISKYPSVERDYAFVVKEDVLAQQMIRAIKKEGRGIIENISIFDFYQGEFLTKGTKSIAIKIIYSSLEKTLKDSDINVVEEKILEALDHQFGAYLRS